MSDRDALLRAICENPDDDAPRLIYADWLDEHDDPRQAEFIRVQIEVARRGIRNYEGHPLAVRQMELWKELRKWRFVLGNWLQLSLSDFRRGFSVRHQCTPAEFVRDAANFWRHGPITHLVLYLGSSRGADLELARRASKCSILKQFLTVDLMGDYVSDEWVQEFISSPAADKWHFLNLQRCPTLTDLVCRILANSVLPRSGCYVSIAAPEISGEGRRLIQDAFGHRHAITERV
jgi:uncharacterized protein (TIGR02996 family)